MTWAMVGGLSAPAVMRRDAARGGVPQEVWEQTASS